MGIGLDTLDAQILQILRFKGRLPYSTIAKRLKVSEGTVRKRVKVMLEKGEIEKFTVETRTTFDFRAVIGIKTKTKKPTMEVVKKLRELPYEISHIYEVTGDYDIICTGETHSNRDMNRLLEKIRALPEVIETKSYSVLVMR